MQLLGLYRRHSQKCRERWSSASSPNGLDGNELNKCSCALWSYGAPEGATHPIRKSMGTTDLRRALRKMDQIDKPDNPGLISRTYLEAVNAFRTYCEANLIKASTITSYTSTLKALEKFLALAGITHVEQITEEHLSEYRIQRTQYLKNYHLLRQQQRPVYRAKPQFASKEGQRKERSHFVAFFDFCVEKKWATVNPARSVKRLKKGDDECAETEPFTNEEVNALVAACDLLDNYNKSRIARARLRAKAIVLTFLYSGLRISDVASLKRSLITPDGKIIRTVKTGKRVYIKLPAACIAALRALPIESAEYFFWGGENKSELATAIKSIRRTITILGRMTQIHAHPHRFRDTFSVAVLVAGHSIRTLQLLLGHKSIKTTEKHYAPFVPAMQKALDEATESLNFDLGPALVVDAH